MKFCRLRLDRKNTRVSTLLAGQRVGICQVDDQTWQDRFVDFNLGCFDMQTGRLDSRSNLLSPKVLTM